MRRRGFTLIELMVVLSIIAVLLAILMPSMERARSVARMSVCEANYHTKVQAFLSYAADRFGQLPVFTYDGSSSPYLTHDYTPKALISYGLKTNDYNDPNQLSGYYANYQGVSDSAWMCPSVRYVMMFYKTLPTDPLSFNSYPATNVLTGLKGNALFMGKVSLSKLSDGNGAIMCETVRSDAAGNPAMPTAHPDDRAVHGFADGSVEAKDAKTYSYYGTGAPAARMNVWNNGAAYWWWFWYETAN